MFRRSAWIFAVVLALIVAPSAAFASEHARATISATAQLSARTSLTVSTDTLRFEVASPNAPAVASVEFVAAARTRSDGEVLMTVEALRAIEGPGGAADVEATVEFSGAGDGVFAAPVRPGVSVVTGRWTGSGRRAGLLQFSLRSGTAGAYVLPVRFILSAP